MGSISHYYMQDSLPTITPRFILESHFEADTFQRALGKTETE